MSNKEIKRECGCLCPGDKLLKQCVIKYCKEYFTIEINNTTELNQFCNKHPSFSCGVSEFICSECKAKGWYSSSGNGSNRIWHYNEKTEEEYISNLF